VVVTQLKLQICPVCISSSDVFKELLEGGGGLFYSFNSLSSKGVGL